MTTCWLSAAAEQFLRARIGSMLHLDVLLLLRRDVQQWVTPAGLASALRVAIESTERALEHMGAANLIDVKIGTSLAYRFAPIDGGVYPLLDEIAIVYYADRQALERVFAERTGAGGARELADAFQPPRKMLDA
jgi:hypothetical protein